MTDDMKRKRDELAQEAGEIEALPFLSSMYQAKSRNEMAKELSFLFGQGFDAAAALYEERERKLVEALRFYADGDNWDMGGGIDGMNERARETLRELGLGGPWNPTI